VGRARDHELSALEHRSNTEDPARRSWRGVSLAARGRLGDKASVDRAFGCKLEMSMAGQNDKTFESTVLDRYPGVRAAVSQSQDFQAWKATLPTVVVDDVMFYIRGGDMLKDEDQVIFEWAYNTGLLPKEAMQGGPETPEATGDKAC
jgi:hypothetical protein